LIIQGQLPIVLAIYVAVIVAVKRGWVPLPAIALIEIGLVAYPSTESGIVNSALVKWVKW
jgi:hypothetical protein